jgi:hypothetical protein
MELSLRSVVLAFGCLCVRLSCDEPSRVTRLFGLLGVWVGWRLVRLVWTNSFNFPEAVAEQSFVWGDAMSCSGEELGPLSFSVGGWSARWLVCSVAGLLGGWSARWLVCSGD